MFKFIANTTLTLSLIVGIPVAFFFFSIHSTEFLKLDKRVNIMSDETSDFLYQTHLMWHQKMLPDLLEKQGGVLGGYEFSQQPTQVASGSEPEQPSQPEPPSTKRTRDPDPPKPRSWDGFSNSWNEVIIFESGQYKINPLYRSNWFMLEAYIDGEDYLLMPHPSDGNELTVVDKDLRVVNDITVKHEFFTEDNSVSMSEEVKDAGGRAPLSKMRETLMSMINYYRANGIKKWMDRYDYDAVCEKACDYEGTPLPPLRPERNQCYSGLMKGHLEYMQKSPMFMCHDKSMKIDGYPVETMTERMNRCEEVEHGEEGENLYATVNGSEFTDSFRDLCKNTVWGWHTSDAHRVLQQSISHDKVRLDFAFSSYTFYKDGERVNRMYRYDASALYTSSEEAKERRDELPSKYMTEEQIELMMSIL